MQAPNGPQPDARHDPATAPKGPDKQDTSRGREYDLLKGGNEVVIRHGGREYRLRRTRFDKLILTA
jgi:hemin uptake protein HemP